jgi:hypothetical protein
MARADREIIEAWHRQGNREFDHLILIANYEDTGIV